MNKEQLIRQKEAEIAADLERWATELGLRAPGETITCLISIEPAPPTIVAINKKGRRKARKFQRLEEEVTKEELDRISIHFDQGEAQDVMNQLLRSLNKPVRPTCSAGSVVLGMNTKLANLGLPYRIDMEGAWGAHFHDKTIKFKKVRVIE